MTGKPTFQELDEVSATGIRITPSVIKALQKEDAVEQQLFISRLSSDIATANVLEKAELLLQAMETGKREPNLASSATIKEFNDASIKSLNTSIKNILLSAEIRKSVSTDSVRLIVAREESRTEFVSGSTRANLQEKSLSGGAVKK